jgi:hypothetical protein
MCVLSEVVYIEVQADWVSEYEVNLDGVPRPIMSAHVQAGWNQLALDDPFFCYGCDQSFSDWQWALQHLQDTCPHFAFDEITTQGGTCHDCGLVVPCQGEG